MVSASDSNQTGGPSPGDEFDDPVEPWARRLALVLGLLAGLAGGYAVFVSDNQAGTALLLVLAVVFLLIGVQGAPLRSLGGGDYQVKLGRLRRRANDLLEQAASQPPEVAAAVREAVTTMDPDNPRIRTLPTPPEQYEDDVRAALARAGLRLDASHRSGRGDRGVDARGELPAGWVNVQAKYRPRGPIGLRDVESMGRTLRASGLEGGYLIVTNAPLSAEVVRHNSGTADEHFEVITWNDERDDDVLQRAVMRVATAASLPN